jgi:hypothetical protein
MASSSLRFVSALAELVRRSRVFSFQCRSVAESSSAAPRGDVQYRPFTGKMKDSELDLDHRIPAGNGLRAARWSIYARALVRGRAGGPRVRLALAHAICNRSVSISL